MMKSVETRRPIRTKALISQKPRCALAPMRLLPTVRRARDAKKRQSVKEKRYTEKSPEQVLAQQMIQPPGCAGAQPKRWFHQS